MIDYFTRLVHRSRAASIGLAVLALAMAAFAGWYSYREYHRWPAVPESLATARAADAVAADASGAGGHGRFVTLEDARWHCGRAVELTRQQLYIPVTDPGDSILVLAKFGERVTCRAAVDERPVTGVLTIFRDGKARDRLFAETESVATARRPGAPIYKLCTSCGPRDARYALYLCIMFTVIGLVLHPLTQHTRATAARDAAKPVGAAETITVGLILATLGAIGMYVGRDWYVRNIPVQWLCALEAAFGLVFILFPNHPRVRAMMEQIKRSAVEPALEAKRE